MALQGTRLQSVAHAVQETDGARISVDSIKGLFSLMSAQASTLGSTTRAARATLYSMSESALSDLEPGNRVPTADEITEIGSAFTVLGMSMSLDAIAALPATQS